MTKRTAAAALALGSLLTLPAGAARGAEDDYELAKTISDSARVWVEYPKKRDPAAVLRLYTKDYTSIHDGELQGRKDMEEVLAILADNLERGRPVDVRSRVSNIQIHATAGASPSWATFQYAARISVDGRVVVEEQGRCTGLYRKEGSGWLVQHEHCSSERPEAGKETR